MKTRLCESCSFRWESETTYGKGEKTKCPRCGAEVRGDSVIKVSKNG